MKLPVTLNNGKPVELRYTENTTKDIYFTEPQSFVLENCQKLKIRLDKLDSEYDDGDIFYSYDSFFVVLSRKSMQYSQYIVLRSAAKTSVRKLAKQFPKSIAERMVNAVGYNPFYD